MDFQKITRKNLTFAIEDSGELLIMDVQSALDLMATARYENCDGLIVFKESVCEAFFDLSTRIAGEILQKFTNYNMNFGIVGDFSGYASNSLHAFIYESNKGKQICFAGTVNEAIEQLS